jgi:hypothetical protein
MTLHSSIPYSRYLQTFPPTVHALRSILYESGSPSLLGQLLLNLTVRSPLDSLPSPSHPNTSDAKLPRLQQDAQG